jgi:hypothetical protein
VLALAAERAVKGVLGIAAADFAHSILRHARLDIARRCLAPISPTRRSAPQPR